MPLGSKYIFCVNKSMKQLKKNHEFVYEKNLVNSEVNIFSKSKDHEYNKIKKLLFNSSYTTKFWFLWRTHYRETSKSNEVGTCLYCIAFDEITKLMIFT